MSEDTHGSAGDAQSASARPPDRTGQRGQPDPDASSDGDRSWTEDPVTADPDEDRSVDAVIERTSRGARPGRTGDEAPYTSEVFEANTDAGTDSPLDASEA